MPWPSSSNNAYYTKIWRAIGSMVFLFLLFMCFLSHFLTLFLAFWFFWLFTCLFAVFSLLAHFSPLNIQFLFGEFFFCSVEKDSLPLVFTLHFCMHSRIKNQHRSSMDREQRVLDTFWFCSACIHSPPHLRRIWLSLHIGILPGQYPISLSSLIQ